MSNFTNFYTFHFIIYKNYIDFNFTCKFFLQSYLSIYTPPSKMYGFVFVPLPPATETSDLNLNTGKKPLEIV